MPSNTANFNLPYPNATDEPCDFAAQWCDFTQAIDDVFDVFQVAINRTIPVIPLAIMRQTITRTVPGFGNIPFDTVSIDTAGMTDIDADPTSITIRRPGRYTVAAMMEKLTAGAPFVTAFTSVFATPKFNAQAMLFDRGAGVTYFLNPYFSVESYAAGDKIGLSFSVAGSPTAFAIERSWLAVIWHSDTEVP